MLCHCGCGKTTRLAPQSSKRLGWVKGQPIRYIRGHSSRNQAKYPEDFYKVENLGHETPCWTWQGHLDKGGYGNLRGDAAHKYYYKKHVGLIPNGYVVHHLCANRACVNPDHLRAVTYSVNAHLTQYPPFTEEAEIKRPKTFRFSRESWERLAMLSEHAELNQTAYLEQLLKREAEKSLRAEKKTNKQTLSY